MYISDTSYHMDRALITFKLVVEYVITQKMFEMSTIQKSKITPAWSLSVILLTISWLPDLFGEDSLDIYDETPMLVEVSENHSTSDWY
jgi:hypothetical protein